MIDQVTKFPIIIVGNYRSGSSALCRHIGEKYNLSFFQEPSLPDRRHIDFLKTYKTTDKYVVKCIANQLFDRIINIPIYQNLLKTDCYKIKINRINKIDQIASYYIAQKTQQWINKKDTKNKPYKVDIDDTHLISCISEILDIDNKLKLLDIQFDKILLYENIGYLENSMLIKTFLPINIEQIKTRIKQLI